MRRVIDGRTGAIGVALGPEQIPPIIALAIVDSACGSPGEATQPMPAFLVAT
jgi:hypothetical protein